MKTRPGDLRAALWFLAPNFLGFGVFTLVPVLLSLGGSFTTWSLRPTTPLRFVGLGNYLALFQDRNFYFYLFNTFYLMLGIPVTMAGSLVLAAFLSGKLSIPRPGRRRGYAGVSAAVSFALAVVLYLTGSSNVAYVLLALGIIASLGLRFDTTVYRTAYYLPYFTSGAGTILLWTQLFNPSFGLINRGIQEIYGLLHLHADAPGWLTSTRSLLGFLPWPAHFNNGGFGLGAREAIMIMGVWAGIGGNNMLLYLAAISNLSPELYEAGDIDGTNAWQRFRHLTVPQLAPTTFFIASMSVIGGLQGGFEQARLMTQGGPAGTTTTLSYYIYTQGFERLDLGYGCAVAWVLFLLIFGLTLLNWRYGNQKPTDRAMDDLKTLLKHAGLIVIAMAMTLPFLWMLGASFKPHTEVDKPGLVPERAQPQNYAVVLKAAPDPYTKKYLDLNFPKWYFNSVFIAAWVTLLQVLTSSMAAYAFARLEWRGRDTVFLLYLSTMMIPGLVLMLPNYQIMVSLKLVNSYAGLILPGAFSAFGTFLMRQFMRALPRSYDEAAGMDGATHLQVFLDIILPLSRGGIISLAIFTFLGNFQSFFWPLVMIRDDYLRTIPVGLLSFSGEYGQQTELLMAATVMNIIPLIALFIVMQKQLVAGIQLGGVKG